MQISQNHSLKSLNSFGLDAQASEYCVIRHAGDIVQALKQTNLPVFVLGGGSNILLTHDVKALVLHNCITGIEATEETDTHVIVKAGGGEVWHSFVLWCIEHNYGGVENLSLIPGTVGAAPVQNIGAYGVELKDVFVALEAVSLEDGAPLKFTRDECRFGYRDSVFKQEWKGRLMITQVYFRLTKKNHRLHAEYAALQSELKKTNISNPDIEDISRAVIAVRSSKLPDPAVLGNAGSFFKNPEITIELFQQLQTAYPDIPSYPAAAGFVKVPAGWLIEKRGWKGKRMGNCGSYELQALVLVNYGGATGAEILNLAHAIIDDVYAHFGVRLSPEVNII